MFFGAILAGVVDAFLPSQALKRMLPKNPVLAVVASAGLGLILPMCECGIIPVIRRMVLKGLPLSCGLTYLLAAPIVNPVVALSTFAAFRGQDPWWMASSRIGLGFGIAVLAGLVLSKLSPRRMLNQAMLGAVGERHSTRQELLSRPVSSLLSLEPDAGRPKVTGELPERRPPATFKSKLVAAIRCAGFDFLDIGFYLVLGAALTALFNTSVNQRDIEAFALNTPVATASMMVLALLLSLCSTSDAFIAANFAVFPAASKMAFMVFGPMVDLKLLFMYGIVFRRRFTLSLALCLFLAVGLICMAWGAIPR